MEGSLHLEGLVLLCHPVCSNMDSKVTSVKPLDPFTTWCPSKTVSLDFPSVDMLTWASHLLRRKSVLRTIKLISSPRLYSNKASQECQRVKCPVGAIFLEDKTIEFAIFLVMS